MSYYTPEEVESKNWINIPAGYYNMSDFIKIIPSLTYDTNTLTFTYKGTILGSLKEVIDNDDIDSSLLCLYVYVDEIDSSKNYFKRKRSTLLSTVPVGSNEVTERFVHQPVRNAKKMIQGEYSSINVRVEDYWGNSFDRGFIAELMIQ